jgi:hypothetical protein
MVYYHIMQQIRTLSSVIEHSHPAKETVIAPGSEHLTVLSGILCREVLKTSYVVQGETSHCMSIADFSERLVLGLSSVYLLLFPPAYVLLVLSAPS